MPLGNPIRKQNESRIISVLATEGQSVFTVEGGYIINQISVFRNGVRLSNSEDFTAGDGSTVTLNDEANVDDRIEFHVFDRFTVNNAIVGAASSQTISGDLVINGKIFGNLDVPSINTGILTATNLNYGKGDISGDLNVTGVSTFVDVNTRNITGVAATFSGDITTNGGDLTISGVTAVLHLTDTNNNDDFSIINENGTFIIRDATDSANRISINSSGVVSIPGNTDFGAGIDVTGAIAATGAISGTTGTFSGDITANGNIVGDNSTNITGIAGVTATTLTGTLQTAAQANVTSLGTLTDLTVSGNVSIADKIIHTGDTNTAIRFPAADQISFETGGVERMIIGVGGDISIQDTIKHSGDTNTKIRFPSTDTVSVETAGSERVRVTSTGVVGINTVGARGATLEIQDIGATGPCLLLAGATDNEGDLAIPDGQDFNIGHWNNVDTFTERFHITSTGKVGISEAIPLGKLHVKEGDSGVTAPDTSQDTLILENNGNAGLTIATPNANTGYITFADPEDSNIGQIIYRHSDNSMSAFVNALERVRITSDGRIGLNVTNPNDYELDIHKRSGEQDVSMRLYNNETASTNDVTLRLHIAGTTANNYIYFGDGDDSNSGMIRYNHSSNYMSFTTNANERARIDSVGRLLVGTTSAMTTGSDDLRDTIQAVYTAGAQLLLARNDSAVTAGNRIGEISALTNDSGGQGFKTGASIRFEADSTMGADDYPTAIAFRTCANSVATPSEKARISSEGFLGVGTNDPAVPGHILSLSGSGEVLRVASSGAASNQVFIGFRRSGTSNTGGIRRDASTSGPEFFASSDRRIKTNIVDMDSVLDKIKQLSLKKFDYKDGSGSGIGLIAQDLINIFPNKVSKDDSDDGSGDTVPDGIEPWTVGHNFTFELLKAVQELISKVEALEGS